MKSFALILVLLLPSIDACCAISKEEFSTVIQMFRERYTEPIKHDLGLVLQVHEFWIKRSMIVSSQARKKDGKALVFIDGDVAQKPEINLSAFVISVCHEFAHLYLDKPKQKKLIREANADYWAARCTAGFFSREHISFVSGSHGFLEERCLESPYGEHACLNTLSGIRSFADYCQLIFNQKLLESTDDLVAHNAFHPNPVCRVKIFLAGLFHDERPECMYRVKIRPNDGS